RLAPVRADAPAVARSRSIGAALAGGTRPDGGTVPRALGAPPERAVAAADPAGARQAIRAPGSRQRGGPPDRPLLRAMPCAADAGDAWRRALGADGAADAAADARRGQPGPPHA